MGFSVLPSGFFSEVTWVVEAAAGFSELEKKFILQKRDTTKLVLSISYSVLPPKSEAKNGFELFTGDLVSCVAFND